MVSLRLTSVDRMIKDIVKAKCCQHCVFCRVEYRHDDPTRYLCIHSQTSPPPELYDNDSCPDTPFMCGDEAGYPGSAWEKYHKREKIIVEWSETAEVLAGNCCPEFEAHI